jgi:hypothetical protein
MTTTKFSPLTFVAIFGSGIRDPGWVKIRIRDKHPGSATLLVEHVFGGGNGKRDLFGGGNEERDFVEQDVKGGNRETDLREQGVQGVTERRT